MTYIFRFIIAGLLIFPCIFIFLCGEDVFLAQQPTPNHSSIAPTLEPKKIGDVIDQFQGVNVYHNGYMDHVLERNTTADGYNLGLKYQCVEFVKRYFYEQHQHKMPDSYGHAKDFFDKKLADGAINTKRAMLQFQNGSVSAPAVGDLLVFDAWLGNAYGHVAIVSDVRFDHIQIVQQNTRSSRATVKLNQRDHKWYLDSQSILGWLRLP